jgi:hypothetical protein
MTRLLLFAASTVGALTVMFSAQTRAPNTPRRILFIGNSLTYFQDGIYTHIEKMGAAASPPTMIQADKAVVGGQYFKTLWEKFPEPRQAIARGYDVVVLQEDLPETTVADFREYSRKFIDEIKRTGARPVLLMAWAYKRLGWISMAEIAQAHRDTAKELNVDVAPVGLAWERAAKERPELDLFIADREHPSIYGTYLATAVVYATVFGENPTGSAYTPNGISAEAATFLRRIAWETVQEYRKQN